MEQISGLNFKIQEMAGRIRELREVEGLSAEEMAQIDLKMLSIRKRIEECTEKPTEDEILLEKLQKISFKLE